MKQTRNTRRTHGTHQGIRDKAADTSSDTHVTADNVFVCHPRLEPPDHAASPADRHWNKKRTPHAFPLWILIVAASKKFALPNYGIYGRKMINIVTMLQLL
jgi:hypothetical protein